MENYLLLRVLKHIKLYVSLYVSLSIDHQNNHNRSKYISHLFQSRITLYRMRPFTFMLHTKKKNAQRRPLGKGIPFISCSTLLLTKSL